LFSIIRILPFSGSGKKRKENSPIIGTSFGKDYNRAIMANAIEIIIVYCFPCHRFKQLRFSKGKINPKFKRTQIYFLFTNHFEKPLLNNILL